MKNNYIKSPLNYTGGKYKLLPQIIPIFPQNINTFVDLFGGGFNVGINIKANKIIYNDIIPELVNLLSDLYKTNTEECLKQMDNTINKYTLSKTNKDGYLQLRNDYNNGNKEWYMFYSLICYSFNNQIEFNKNKKFNNSFGRNKSSFNPSLRNKFVMFVNELHNKNITFLNKDFNQFEINNNLSKNDFIYCDSPYLITTTTYGRSRNNGWNETKERELLNFLDNLNSHDIKFALSNVLENKGETNEILKEWSNKYNIHYLENTYKNCNYQRKDKSNNTTKEVLITNY